YNWDATTADYTPGYVTLPWRWTLSNTVRQTNHLQEKTHPLESILNGRISHYTISPQGNYVTAISPDGNGIIWDSQAEYIVGMMYQADVVFWSPDEEQLAVQRQDNSVWIMSPVGRVIYRLPARAVKYVSYGARLEHPIIAWSE